MRLPVSLCFLAAFQPLAAHVAFLPLGYLDGWGPTSEAIAISSDATKMVGYSASAGNPNLACVWTASSPGSWLIDGRLDLLSTSPQPNGSNALAVSAAGSVVVGLNGFGGTEDAYYWTAAGQLQLIPLPPEPLRRNSVAWGVSPGGDIVVGHTDVRINQFSDAVERKGFAWNRNQAQAVYLLPLTGSLVPNRVPLGASANGSRIVGYAQASLSAQAAVRWDNGGAPQILHQPTDTVISFSANSISFDGNVVVGQAIDTVAGRNVAFKWTPAGGMVALPPPTTGTHAYQYTTAIRVSGNGRVIVGYGENVLGDDEAIFWVDGQPFRVSDIAFAAGVLPPSWAPQRAYGVDYTGNSISGFGRATSGKLEAYLLVIDTTPAPPPVVAPSVDFAYDRTGNSLKVHYQTAPGAEYRILGGSNLQSLAPLGGWQAGTGGPVEFVAGPATTGGAPSYFLRVEARNN